MTDFFFPKNKCGVANKVEKPVFKFVADCNIEPTPKPIFDCPLPIIAREPEIPCPEFNVKSKLDVGYSTTPDKKVENCGVQNKIKFDIKKKVDDSCPANANKCEFDVELEVNVAIPAPPCPVLKVGEFSVKSGYKDQPCVEDESRFQVRTRNIPGQNCDDPGTCEFEFDLEVVVPIPRPPCPEINVRTFSVRSDYIDQCERGKNKFEITTRHRQPESCDDPGECNFDVDLEIYVPIPRPPCPEIKITSFSVGSSFDVPGCDRKENKFEIRRTYKRAPCDDPLQQDTCDFEVDLQIFIPIPAPPCPTINVKSFEVKSGFVNTPCAQGTNKFKITKRETPVQCDRPAQCDFDVELEIVIPIPLPPCPEITVKKFEVTSDYIGCQQGRNRFVITKAHRTPENCDKDPGKCAFDVELEINVPLPRPPCPEIKVKTFEIKIGYPVAECGNTEDSPCGGRNKFVISRRQTPPDCQDLQNPGTCEFDVELEIFVPAPRIPCPEINIKKFEVKTGYAKSPCVGDGGSTFTVVKRTIPCTCDEPERCEFDLELSIRVPIPQPPCPIIKIKKFEVTSDYVSRCDQGRNKFTITTDHTPPSNCTDDAGQCRFDIELEINVPIPEPPCPEIRVKTFNVVPRYPTCVPPPPYDNCPGTNQFKITRKYTKSDCKDPDKKPGECEFDVELEIAIPPPKIPCPDIKIKTFKVITDYQKCLLSSGSGSPPPSNKLEITRRIIPCKCDELERCEFDIELEIVVPLPDPPCPEIVVKAFSVVPLYPVCIPPPVVKLCDNPSKFDITKKVKPPCEKNGVKNPPECNFELDVVIAIPPPKIPCPEFKIKTFKVKSECVSSPNGGKNKFEITKRVIPCTCEELERCEFDIELEINVPIPEMPCPEIKGKLDVNYVEYNPIITPPNLAGCNFFGITKRTSPPPCDGDVNSPANCEYEIDLRICVPTPKIKCPTFKIKTFKVESKFEDCVVGANKFTVTKNPARNDSCDFDIELEIYIPIPRPRCPLFATNLFFNTFLHGCGVPGGVFRVIDDPFPGNCNDPGVCAYLFDLQINIPLPRFVSEVAITQQPAKINVDWCVPGKLQKSTAKLTFNRKANLWAGMCDRGNLVWYESLLELDIVLPPISCDLFKLKPKRPEFPVARVPVGREYIKLKIDPKPKVGCNPCEFEFDLDIQLNCICRTDLTTLDGSLNVGDCYDTTQPNPSGVGAGGRIWLEIRKERDCRDLVGFGCVDQFVLIPNIDLPPPKFPCPEFNADDRVKIKYLTDRNADPYGTLKFELQPKVDPCDPCVFYVDLEIYIPKPCYPKFKFRPDLSRVNACYYSDKATLETCGDPYTEINIEETSVHCEYDVWVYTKPNIYEPPNTCDEFITDTGIDVHYLTSRTDDPYATLTIEPRARADSDTYCTYDVKFDIYIPKPCYPKFNFKPDRCSYNPCYYSDKATFEVCKPDDDEFAQVYIEESNTDECEYDVWIYSKPAVYEPALYCDEYYDKGVKVNYLSDPNAAPYGNIKFTPRPITDSDNHCTYDVELELYLKKLCKPTFTYSTASSVTPLKYTCPYDFNNAIANLNNKFRVEITDKGYCDYDVKFTSQLPVYEPKPITFVKGTQQVIITPVSSSADPSGTVDITITQDSGDCSKFTVAATIELKLPNPICTGTVQVNSGTLGTGTLYCSNDEYQIDITLNTTDCASASSGTQKMQAMPMLAADDVQLEDEPQTQNNDFIPTLGDPLFQQNPFSSKADIINPWRNENFVNGFIDELGKNVRLQNAVKALLKD